jgi:hypothetical protein
MSAVLRIHPAGSAARAAACLLRRWLLRGPAQLSRGEHHGGVAGRITDGKPDYVYAEITGYYLHWLADLQAAESRVLLGERARRAIDWATRQFAHGRVPATRAYLDAAERDWRNDAVFFFDLAMLLRGLTAVAEAGIDTPPDPLLAAVVRQLAEFVDNDTLRAVRPLRADAELPRRWSTLGGPFLLKASSRVAIAARKCAIPQPLLDACAAELAHWSPIAADISLEMLHPTLYFAEGLLLAEPERAIAIATLLARCLALQNDDGSLPETASESTLARSDIIAQALRVGVLLRQQDVPGAPSDCSLDQLAGALLARVCPDGSIAFGPDAAAPQPNAWCAMFAEQALRWYADWRDGTPTARIEALV